MTKYCTEPLIMVRRARGQKGFEAWRAIVGKYDLRNMSDNNVSYAALISNLRERDRAKVVEQFYDILRTFINKTCENRFGKIRDEEKMFAVKKLMPESFMNFRFRGSTLKHEEFLIASKNISIAPTARQKQSDTCAPMEIEGAREKEVSE